MKLNCISFVQNHWFVCPNKFVCSHISEPRYTKIVLKNTEELILKKSNVVRTFHNTVLYSYCMRRIIRHVRGATTESRVRGYSHDTRMSFIPE